MPCKMNKVLDALSYLTTKSKLANKNNNQDEALEDICIQGHPLTLIETNKSFLTQIKEANQTDKRWSKMKADIETNNALGKKAGKLLFSFEDDLIWLNDCQNNST